jgi:hypothetical protein
MTVCDKILFCTAVRDTCVLVSSVRPRDVAVTQHLIFTWQQMLSWVCDGALSQFGGRQPTPGCFTWRRFKMFNASEIFPKRRFGIWYDDRSNPNFFFFNFLQPVARTLWVHVLTKWKRHYGHLILSNGVMYGSRFISTGLGIASAVSENLRCLLLLLLRLCTAFTIIYLKQAMF